MAAEVDVVLKVWCGGAQIHLGLSDDAVKLVFVDPRVASDARITSYTDKRLWDDGGPLVRASANPSSCPLRLGTFQVNGCSMEASRLQRLLITGVLSGTNEVCPV